MDKAIDQLIDKIVRGIGKLFAMGKAVAGKLVSWWKAKKQFEGADGETHTLSFSGEGKSAGANDRQQARDLCPVYYTDQSQR